MVSLDMKKFLNKTIAIKTATGVAASVAAMTAVNSTMSHTQAQDVVQIFEPREIAIPWARGIKSALKNDIAIIVTRELLCITIAQTAHKVILFQILFVNFFKTFSNQPPVNSLNHCPKKIIQNKNKAIHPDIIQKFLL